MTDGLGHFVVSNTGSAYRRVPAQNYAPAQYSSGRYRLVIEFASWSLDPSNAGSLAFEVSDAKNRRIAGLNLYADKGASAKIRFSEPPRPAGKAGALITPGMSLASVKTAASVAPSTSISITIP